MVEKKWPFRFFQDWPAVVAQVVEHLSAQTEVNGLCPFTFACTGKRKWQNILSKVLSGSGTREERTLFSSSQGLSLVAPTRPGQKRSKSSFNMVSISDAGVEQ